MTRTRPTTLDVIAVALTIAAVSHYGWRSLPPAIGAAASVGYNLLFGLAALTCFFTARRFASATASDDVVAWRLVGAGFTMILGAQAVNIGFGGTWVEPLSDVLALGFYPLVIMAFSRQSSRPTGSGARRAATLDLALVFCCALTVMLALQLRIAGVTEWSHLSSYAYRTIAPSVAIVAVAAVANWLSTVSGARRASLLGAGAAAVWVALGDLGLNIFPSTWDRWSNVSWALGACLLIVGAQRAVPSSAPDRQEAVIDGATSSLIPMLTAGALLITLLAMLVASGGPEPLVLASGGSVITILLLARHAQALRFASALERVREQQEVRLRESERLDALGRMARGVAHDFNGMLTAILGNAEVALDARPLSPDVRESLEQIRQSALTAAGITRQLLDFARTGTVKKIDVDVRHVVRAQWSVLAGTLPHTITAELRVDADDLTIRTGAGFVEQVLHNLVINARDAMPNGGALSVDLRGTGSTVTLTVLDTGSGMTEETQRRLFEPFYSTKGRLGTGLGLATVYGIVRQSEGTIRVESAIGRGTSFVLQFPRADR